MVNDKLELKEHKLEGLPILNRKGRKEWLKKYGIFMLGIQDSKESTLKVYYIPMKRKSRAGVEYIYYKKVVDKIGLDSK